MLKIINREHQVFDFSLRKSRTLNILDQFQQSKQEEIHHRRNTLIPGLNRSECNAVTARIFADLSSAVCETCRPLKRLFKKDIGATRCFLYALSFSGPEKHKRNENVESC